MKFEEAKEEDGNLSLSTFCERYGIKSKSMIQKWLKEKDKILKKVYEGCGALKRNREIPKRNPKHDKTYEKLYPRFCDHRKKGNKVSFQWFYIIGRKIAIEHSFPTFTKKAVEMFLKRFNIKHRRVQCKKQKPKSDNEEGLKQWHLKLRETLLKSNRSSSDYHEKLGRFELHRRFNVDQVHN